jgi:hypothetical protein
MRTPSHEVAMIERHHLVVSVLVLCTVCNALAWARAVLVML